MECHWKFLASLAVIIVFSSIFPYSNASSLYNDQNEAEEPQRNEQEHEEFPNQIDLERSVRQDVPVLDDGADDQETTESTDGTNNERGQEGRGLSETGKPDNAIDDFLMHVFNFGVKHTISSLSKFGLPEIDPMKLPDFNLEKEGILGTGAKGATTEMAVVGLGGLSLRNLHTDLNNMSIHFEFGLPGLAVVGKYNISAKMLYVININGDGPFKIGIEDAHFYFGGSITLEQPMTLKIDLCNLTIKAVKGEFDKLTGNSTFKQKINEVVNTLATKIVEMIEPTVCSQIKIVLETFVAKEMAGVKIPTGLLGVFNKFKSFVSTIKKATGRKKRSLNSGDGAEENFFKLAMIPYLIGENPEKYLKFKR